MPKKTPKVDEAVAAALAGIRDAELRIAALDFSYRSILREADFFGGIKEDYSRLHSALYRNLNNAYRNLAMWGTLHPNEETRKRAGRLLWQRFLKEGSEIMNYLDPQGIPPSAYSSEEHDKFRKELNHLADLLDIPEEDRRR